MEEINILMEKVTRVEEKQQNIINQLDQDRKDIDLLRIDQASIKEGQQAIIKQMTDFKAEIRQQVQDVIASELPKVAKKVIREEIRLLSARNPKKVIKGRLTIWDRAYKLFKGNG